LKPVCGSRTTQGSLYENGWPVFTLMMMPRRSSLRKQSRVLCASLATTGVFDPSGLS
jgi:hypothetical protein